MFVGFNCPLDTSDFDRGGYSRSVSFLSGISMEIYLCHMVMFRVIEKLHLNIMLGIGWFQYIVTVALVFIGAACFSVVVKKIIKIIGINW